MNVGGAQLFTVCLSILCGGHSNLVIFNWISSKFHIWIASIKHSLKLELRYYNESKGNGKMRA